MRKQIFLKDKAQVKQFVNKLSRLSNDFVLEDISGRHRIDAKSLIGVLYAFSEFKDGIFLVNETDDGNFPE